MLPRDKIQVRDILFRCMRQVWDIISQKDKRQVKDSMLSRDKRQITDTMLPRDERPIWILCYEETGTSKNRSSLIWGGVRHGYKLRKTGIHAEEYKGIS